MPAISWTLADIPPQDGRRFLITGANSGIGYVTTLELARHGATVVMACRDLARANEAAARIRSDVPGAKLEVLPLELSSLANVREFVAGQILPLDGLINNAGVYAPPVRRETEDGFELQFGTNVLAHFCLTLGLLPLLEQAPAARVITVASIAHKRGKIYWEDPQSERKYSPMGAYQQSKLADLLFAQELDRRLVARGSRVRSLAVHPGVAKTALFKIGNSKGLAALAEKAIANSVGLLMNDDAEGALPTLFAATAPQAQGGGYYGPQGWQETRGGDVGPAERSALAADPAVQARLFDLCEELTGCTFA